MRQVTECLNVHLPSDRLVDRNVRINAVLNSVVNSADPDSPLATTHHDTLIELNRRKDEFLAVLGHELRSPLAAIQSALRLFATQTGDSALRQRAQGMIERQVHRMTQLVEDLQDVSRVTHGRLHLHRERVDLRVVVNHAIETVISGINDSNQNLSVALPPEPVWLHADPLRLEQVFVNLLTNASKYTNAGGALAIWVHTSERQAVVRVRDSGIGIEAKFLPHVFDLFKQVSGADPRSKLGLGVGLAVVRDLIRLHGGSVTVASGGLNQGSEFTVHLLREA